MRDRVLAGRGKWEEVVEEVEWVGEWEGWKVCELEGVEVALVVWDSGMEDDDEAVESVEGSVLFDSERGRCGGDSGGVGGIFLVWW